MLGLLWKDLLVLQKQARLSLAILVLFAAVYLPSGNASILTVILFVFLMMLPITTFTYDDLAKWDRMARSMPLTPPMLVGSKYLLTCLLGLLAFALSFVLGLIGNAVFPASNVSLGVNLGTAAIGFLAALLLLAIVLPFCYKLGVERSRLIMMAVILLPTALILFFGDRIDALNLPAFAGNIQLLFGGFLLLVLVVLFVSYQISLRIYRNKEL